MLCRKCNFVLIDIEVGLLLTFLASMKAKVRLYQKYVSVLGVYTCRFQVSVFKVSSLVSGFKSLRFACAFSSFVCKRKAKTVTKCSFLCWKRSRVNAAKAKTLGYSNYTPWLWHLLKIIVLSDVTCRSVMEPCACPFSLVHVSLGSLAKDKQGKKTMWRGREERGERERVQCSTTSSSAVVVVVVSLGSLAWSGG